MSLIARRFRGIVVAIVVLGLSASAVFAANVLPQLTGAFSAGAATAQQERSEADEDQNEAPDADEATDATEDAPDADQEASDNHGALVSEAAHMDTPAGFRNHGAFVSCVAHMKDLPAGAPPVDLAALTPADCGIDQTAEDATDSDQEASDNHGALVSAAAHMATPAGFRNHGAFVSCVAHVKDVPADTAAFFAALKATDCQRADAQADEDTSTSTDADGPKKDKAAKVKHGHGRGNTR